MGPNCKPKADFLFHGINCQCVLKFIEKGGRTFPFYSAISKNKHCYCIAEEEDISPPKSFVFNHF